MSKKEYEISIWKDILDTSNKVLYNEKHLSEKTSYNGVKIQTSGGQCLPILTEEGKENYYCNLFKEQKIATIGTDKISGENFAHSIKFKKNINGTSTLTFRLFITYTPPGEVEKIENPFIKLITNDTKIKIKYQGEWTDLIVKEIVEYSAANEIEYKATDLYIEELSKNGLLLTYDDTNFNNTDNIYNLGARVLEGTDWSISKNNSDLIRQKVEETIYRATINSVFPTNSVYEITDDGPVAVPYHNIKGSYIYIFHSSLNKDEMRFQFLYETNHNGTYSYNPETGLIKNVKQCYVDWSGNMISSVNVSTIQNGAVVNTPTEVNLPQFIQSLTLITDCRGERVVLNKKTHNDTTLGQLVNLYNYSGSTFKKGTCYGFTSFTTTSLYQKNLICNSRGTNKSFLKSTPEGWWGASRQLRSLTGADRSLLQIRYIDGGSPSTTPSVNEDTGSYTIPAIKMQFTGKNTNISEIENYGLLNEDNLPDGFSPGEEYTFRVKYCLYVRGAGTSGSTIPTFLPPSYAYDNNYINGAFKRTTAGQVPLRIGIEVYYTENINNTEVKRTILTTSPSVSAISNYSANRSVSGTLGKDETMIDEGNSKVQLRTYNSRTDDDNVAEWYEQTLYVNKGIEPLSKSQLIELCRQKRLHIKVTALRNGANSFSNKTVTNNIKVIDDNGAAVSTTLDHVRLEDVQLFKTNRDMEGNVIATNFSQPNLSYGIKTIYNYYSQNDTYESQNEIPWLYREEARYMYSKMTPLYNEEILAIKNFSAKDSNRFNLIQKLCEKFECWAKFNIEHNSDGSVVYENGLPKKYITFHNYVGQENKLGFSYGRNLNSIQRNINSNNITTKIIVKPGVNEYGKNGTCDISRSKLNPSRDIYFYDFSYYFNKGFLDRQEIENDLFAPVTKNPTGVSPLSFYSKMTYYNKMAQEASDCLISINSEYNNIYEEYMIYYQNKTGAEFELEKLFLEETDTNWDAWYHAYYSSSNDFNNYSLKTKTNCVIKVFNRPNIWKSSNIKRNGHTESYWYNMFNSLFTKINEQSKSYNVADKKLQQIIPTKQYYEKQISYLNQNLQLIKEKKLDIEKAFYNKYNRFIKEGLWTSNDYVNDDTYYLDSTTTLHNSSQPKVTYSIQVVDIGSLDEYKYYNFYVGDRTYVEDVEFFGYQEDGVTPYRESIIITEIEYDLDANENTKLTVQNFKDEFESLFQRITAQTQSLQFYQGSYNRAASAIGGNGVNYSALQKVLNENENLSITNPRAKNVKMGTNGITSTNPKNTSQAYRIGNKGFEVTYESGASWMSLNELLEALVEHFES